MFSVLLFLHILAAIVMAGIAFRSLFDIVRRNLTRLPCQAKSLAVLLLAEAASGSLLGLLAPEFSLARFCVNVSLYISAFLLVEFAILVALKKSPHLVFPHRYAYASASISLVAFILVILVRTPIL